MADKYSTSEKYPHDGHRNRVRQKFLNSGLSGMEEHEILEMLLFYTIPRKDTHQIAYRLLEKWGTLAEVLKAPIEKLEECGLPNTAAVYIRMLSEVCEKYGNAPIQPNDTVKKSVTEKFQVSSDHIIRIKERLLPYFIGMSRHERAVILLSDKHGRELFTGVVHEGNVYAVDIYFPKILALALQYRAYQIVFAHNYPHHIPMPSVQDTENVLKLKRILANEGIRLWDYIIFSDTEMIALSEMDELF